jgi:hypothetical protein
MTKPSKNGEARMRDIEHHPGKRQEIEPTGLSGLKTRERVRDAPKEFILNGSLPKVPRMIESERLACCYKNIVVIPGWIRKKIVEERIS